MEVQAANFIGQSDGAVLMVLFILQGIWGLFLIVLTWAMRRVLRDIEENTKATNAVAESVGAINVLLSGNYVQRSESDRLEARIREVEQGYVRLETRLDLRGKRQND